MRRVTVIALGALGLAMRATAPAAQPATAPTAQVSREDIEWLDIWLPHTNDHQLPRVLLIGDSITRGYYPDVEKALAGRAYVARLSTSKSLGDPALLKEIALILSEERYHVIHFNNGLHGSGDSEAVYAQALPSVMAVFRRHAPGTRLIWASTTDMLPSFEGDHPTLLRIIERNRLAALWAAKNGIPPNISSRLPRITPNITRGMACISRRRVMRRWPRRSHPSSVKCWQRAREVDPAIARSAQ